MKEFCFRQWCLAESVAGFIGAAVRLKDDRS